MRVSRTTAGSNDVAPAARVDIEKTAADGETARNITGRDGAVGVSARRISSQPASTPARERPRPILILSGAKAPDKVNVPDTDGARSN
jgi:hypothetical protein